MLTFWYFFKLGFLLTYTSICAGIAYWIYNGEKKYYEPIYVLKKTGEGKDDEKTVYLHDEFDEFARKDSPVSFMRIFFGTLTITLFKLFASMSFAISLSFKLFNKMKKKEAKKENLTKEEIQQNIESTKFHTSSFLRFSGIFHFKIRLPDEEILPVYQKYFGPDYKIDYDGKFCCYICNHTSFNDILIAMANYGCGFISKLDVKSYPIFGKIAQGLQSIFVDRSNPNSRKEVLDKIIERQKDYIEGKPVMPLMIFPEGTTTSGRHLLKFKRGAFYSLLPIKPQLILLDDDLDYSIGIGAGSPGFNYLRSLCYLGTRVNLCQLPVIKPTDYMWEHYSHLGAEKWEIFAEVTRNIMCEIGKLQPSNRTFRDSKHYENSLIKGKYHEENNDLLKV